VELDQLVGTWELEEVITVGKDGVVTYPHGDHPVGVLLYTQDGGMSATIAPQPNQDELSVCYAGRVSVESDILIHKVLVGAAPFPPGSRLIRDAQLLADGTLRLTASAQDGTERTSLTWKRPQPSSEPED
jgi:hypothetical protein